MDIQKEMHDQTHLYIHLNSILSFECLHLGQNHNSQCKDSLTSLSELEYNPFIVLFQGQYSMHWLLSLVHKLFRMVLKLTNILNKLECSNLLPYPLLKINMSR
jgi:hypothetical protein